MLSSSFVARVALLAYVLLITAPLSCSVNASPARRTTTSCNGSPDLCDRSFGNVTFVGAHDSYAVGVNNRESLRPPLSCFEAEQCRSRCESGL